MGQIIKRPSFADAEKAGITPPLWLNPVLRDRHIKGNKEWQRNADSRGEPSYFIDTINSQALIYLFDGTGKPCKNNKGVLGKPGTREIIETNDIIGYDD